MVCYRLITIGGGGLLINYFVTAEEGSVLNQVYRKFLAQEDYEATKGQTVLETLREVEQSDDLLAFFFIEQSVGFYSEFQCSLSVPWKTHFPNLLSLAFPKGSPYRQFFQMKLLQHQEKGTVPLLRKKWVKSWDDVVCSPKEEALGLGLEKLIGLFGLLGLAGSLSVLLCLIELFSRLGAKNSAEKGTELDYFRSPVESAGKVLALKYGILQKEDFLRDFVAATKR